MKLITLNLLITIFITSAVDCIAQESGNYSLKDVQEYEIIKVQKGQTLYGLAKNYQTTVANLLNLNPSLTDNNLRSGSSIKVPKINGTGKNLNTKQSTKINSGYTGIGPQPFLTPLNHRVAKDETLYSIAKKTGNDVEVLKLWNDLKTDLIKPGQELIVGYTDGTSSGNTPISGTFTKEDAQGLANIIQTDKQSPQKNITTDAPLTTVDKKKLQTSPTLTNESNTVSVQSVNSTKTTSAGSTTVNSTTTPITNPVVEAPNTSKVTTSIYDQNKPDTKLVYLSEKGLCTYTKGNSGGSFFALHPTAPMGTMINVRNMMNNTSIQAKVIGRLPNTPENENILIKLSGSAAEALKAVDDRFLVQISYMGYDTGKSKQ
jgi:LysM repeat protein